MIFPRFVNCQDGPPAAGLGAHGEALEAWLGIGNLTSQSRSGGQVDGTLTVAMSRVRNLERRIAVVGVVGDRESVKKEAGRYMYPGSWYSVSLSDAMSLSAAC